MSILSRYIIKQHIAPFVGGFSLITLIWILNLLFKELNRFLSKGLPASVIIEFFALSLAWIIALTIPMAALIATLMAFGRMSADNEITAIKASGISFYRIIAPVISAGAVLTILLIWFNNSVLPDFNHRLRNLLQDIARKKPTMRIEPGVWYDELSHYGILVSAIEDSAGVSKIYNVMLNDYSEVNVTTTLIAERGTIRVDERYGLLEIELFDGEMQKTNVMKPNEFQRLFFPRHLVRIDITDMFLTRNESNYRGDREKSAAVMRQEVAEYQQKIDKKLAEMYAVIGKEFQTLFSSDFGMLPDSVAQAKDSTAGRETSFSPPQPLRAVPQKTAPGGKTIARQIRVNRPVPEHIAWSEQNTIFKKVRGTVNIINNFRKQQNKLLVEIEKKYAIAFACIVFIIVGAPLGIMARSGGMAFGGGVSLFFFLLFWASLINGEDLADRGLMSPFLAMWRANILVGAGGLFLMFLLVTENSFSRFFEENRRQLLLYGYVLDWWEKRREGRAA